MSTIYAIGWLLFAASTFRARVFPRAATVALGGSLLLYLPTHHVGPLIFEGALLWLGASAWRAGRGTAVAAASADAAAPVAPVAPVAYAANA